MKWIMYWQANERCMSISVHRLRCASVRYNVTLNYVILDESPQSNAVLLHRYTFSMEKTVKQLSSVTKNYELYYSLKMVN